MFRLMEKTRLVSDIEKTILERAIYGFYDKAASIRVRITRFCGEQTSGKAYLEFMCFL